VSGDWVRIDYLGKPMLVRRLVRSSKSHPRGWGA